MTTPFKIGQAICFKNGTEQYGTVKQIKRNAFGRPVLVVKVYDSNTGSYETVEVAASDATAD